MAIKHSNSAVNNEAYMYLCTCSTVWGQMQVVLWRFLSCGFSIKYIHSFHSQKPRPPATKASPQLNLRATL